MTMEWAVRREIADIARQVYARGFATATDGNISVRVMGDRLFITPSGVCLGTLQPSDLLYVDFEGNVLSGSGRPSTELPMHVTAYRQRSDVNAAIHAHPVAAVSCSVAGVSLETPVIPEVVMTLGPVPTAPYGTPSTQESAESIHDLIRSHDAIVLDHHGTLTVGRTLLDAFRKLEKLEYCAEVTWIARQLGRVTALTSEQVAKLDDLAERYGLPHRGAARSRPGAGLPPRC